MLSMARCGVNTPPFEISNTIGWLQSSFSRFVSRYLAGKNKVSTDTLWGVTASFRSDVCGTGLHLGECSSEVRLASFPVLMFCAIVGWLCDSSFAHVQFVASGSVVAVVGLVARVVLGSHRCWMVGTGSGLCSYSRYAEERCGLCVRSLRYLGTLVNASSDCISRICVGVGFERGGHVVRFAVTVVSLSSASRRISF